MYRSGCTETVHINVRSVYRSCTPICTEVVVPKWSAPCTEMVMYRTGPTPSTWAVSGLPLRLKAISHWQPVLIWGGDQYVVNYFYFRFPLPSMNIIITGRYRISSWRSTTRPHDDIGFPFGCETRHRVSCVYNVDYSRQRDRESDTGRDAIRPVAAHNRIYRSDLLICRASGRQDILSACRLLLKPRNSNESIQITHRHSGQIGQRWHLKTDVRKYFSYTVKMEQLCSLESRLTRFKYMSIDTHAELLMYAWRAIMWKRGRCSRNWSSKHRWDRLQEKTSRCYFPQFQCMTTDKTKILMHSLQLYTVSQKGPNFETV